MGIELKTTSGNITLTTPKATGGSVDLSNYYTKEQTDSQIETALADYAKTEDVNDYVNEVATEIETIIIPDALADYALIESVDDALAELKAEVDTELEGYVKVTDLPDMSEYVTETELEAEGYATTSYVDTAIEQFDVDLTGYATEEYVSTQIAAIEHPVPDMSNYYTKEEVEALIPTYESGDEVSY